jgi:hypothetical protein
MTVKLLSASERDWHLKNTIQLALDNFGLANQLGLLLQEYVGAGIPPPSANVSLRGLGRCPDIPGENCGFFTTPVIQTALLDCRRSLEFFGITCDSESGRLKKISKRRKDDLGIEHFGLQLISPAKLIHACSQSTSADIAAVFVTIHHWCNKQVAHFTLTEPTITFGEIRSASIAMIEAYQCLLLDGLGLPRMRLRLSVH